MTPQLGNERAAVALFKHAEQAATGEKPASD